MVKGKIIKSVIGVFKYWREIIILILIAVIITGYIRLNKKIIDLIPIEEQFDDNDDLNVKISEQEIILDSLRTRIDEILKRKNKVIYVIKKEKISSVPIPYDKHIDSIRTIYRYYNVPLQNSR